MQAPEPARPTRTSVEVVQRHCLACGRYEKTPDGKPLYLDPHKLPRDNACQDCGTRTMVADEIITIVTVREAAFDWNAERPRRGRPPRVIRIPAEDKMVFIKGGA